MAGVAQRRFDDAEALCNTNDNARANGAAYLLGFVLEILLKARLVAKYPTTARKRQHEVLTDEQGIWILIWRQHDLAAMLDQLPEIEAALAKRYERDPVNHREALKMLCATWTIQARYSPHQISNAEAREMLEHVRPLKELLR